MKTRPVIQRRGRHCGCRVPSRSSCGLQPTPDSTSHRAHPPSSYASDLNTPSGVSPTLRASSQGVLDSPSPRYPQTVRVQRARRPEPSADDYRASLTPAAKSPDRGIPLGASDLAADQPGRTSGEHSHHVASLIPAAGAPKYPVGHASCKTLTQRRSPSAGQRFDDDFDGTHTRGQTWTERSMLDTSAKELSTGAVVPSGGLSAGGRQALGERARAHVFAEGGPTTARDELQ